MPNGTASAYYQLSYDLYTIKHNARLQTEVIRRLKNKDQFQGARYELIVAAIMVRGGFDIDYEDERDGTRRHPEFLATHKISGEKVSIEAKSRHRAGVLGHPGEQEEVMKADVGKLLTQALLKEPPGPCAVFVDLNVPPLPKEWVENITNTAMGKELMKTVNRAGKHFEDGKDAFNGVFFTNFPQHYGSEDEIDPPKHYVAILSQHPRHRLKNFNALLDVSEALRKYGNIPNEFLEA